MQLMVCHSGAGYRPALAQSAQGLASSDASSTSEGYRMLNYVGYQQGDSMLTLYPTILIVLCIQIDSILGSGMSSVVLHMI